MGCIMAGSVMFAENNSSCINGTESIFSMYIGAGVSETVCFLLLGLALVFEVFYICRNKTTFLQCLFFYFTIAATLAEVPYVLFFVLDVVLNEDTSTCSGLSPFLFNCLFLLYPAFLIELLVIGSINLTLLSKLYKYRVSRQSHDPGAEYMLCCCYYKKWREILFCVIGSMATLLLVASIHQYFTEQI